MLLFCSISLVCRYSLLVNHYLGIYNLTNKCLKIKTLTNWFATSITISLKTFFTTTATRGTFWKSRRAFHVRFAFFLNSLAWIHYDNKPSTFFLNADMFFHRTRQSSRALLGIHIWKLQSIFLVNLLASTKVFTIAICSSRATCSSSANFPNRRLFFRWRCYRWWPRRDGE